MGRHKEWCEDYDKEALEGLKSEEGLDLEALSKKTGMKVDTCYKRVMELREVNNIRRFKRTKDNRLHIQSYGPLRDDYRPRFDSTPRKGDKGVSTPSIQKYYVVVRFKGNANPMTLVAKTTSEKSARAIIKKGYPLVVEIISVISHAEYTRINGLSTNRSPRPGRGMGSAIK